MTARIQLSVRTDMPTAEIAVIGPDFDLVDRGIGKLVTKQPKGIYSIKVRLGRETIERLVVLDRQKTETFEAMQRLASPIPILGTARSHEYQAEGTFRHTRRVDFKSGKGAEIFLSTRYWASEADRAGRRRRHSAVHPAAGIGLYPWRSGSRSMPAALVDFEKTEWLDQTRDPWSASTVQVNPGVYVVGWNSKDGRHFEFPVVASPKWQTQIYLRRRIQNETEQFQASALSDLSITMERMSNAGGRADQNYWNRMAMLDSARIALAHDRPLLSRDVSNLLLRKFDNPILGILGLHMMLVARKQAAGNTRSTSRSVDPELDPQINDPHLYDTVIRNLRSLVGGQNHPDVEALSLVSRDPKVRARGPFQSPPMFRAGWDVMIEASRKNPELVPAPLWREVALMTELRPFLIWQHSSEEGALPKAFREAAGRAMERVRKFAALKTATGEPDDVPAAPERARTMRGPTRKRPVLLPTSAASSPATSIHRDTLMDELNVPASVAVQTLNAFRHAGGRGDPRSHVRTAAGKSARRRTSGSKTARPKAAS